MRQKLQYSQFINPSKNLLLLMRLSNCSAPTPPGAALGSKEKCCVIEKGGALQNEVKKGRGTQKKGEISDYIMRDKVKSKVIRGPGQPHKK